MAELLGLVWIDGLRPHERDLPAPPDSVSFATIDWRMTVPMVDNDLPVKLCVLLARALLTLGTVVFVDHAIGPVRVAREWKATPGGHLCSLPVAYPWWRLPSRRTTVNVMATESEDILSTLGLAEGGWTLQQQVLFVVEDHAVIDRLDGNVIAGWMGCEPTPDHRATFGAGIGLAMVPGHDGGWCRLFAPSRQVLSALRKSLRSVCHEAGMKWVEGDTAEHLRFAGFGPWPGEP